MARSASAAGFTATPSASAPSIPPSAPAAQRSWASNTNPFQLRRISSGVPQFWLMATPTKVQTAPGRDWSEPMTAYIALFVSLILIVVDQVIKIWAYQSLSQIGSVLVIPHLLRLTYVENFGAAFGILQQRRWLLIGITVAVLAFLVWTLLAKKVTEKPMVWSFALIIAGGAGNLIDRMQRGFVVDYLDVSPLFSFPVFNFADCCVVIGTALMIFYILVLEPKQREGK
ncbi:MAG: signal peptidase II [Oscillospiraceae bacterium]|nr:MAG: signal peptidase II [Oscillospiraceae bacterium]